MDRTEAAKILTTLQHELTQADQRVAALNKLIEGYRELFPDLEADDSPGEVVADDPDRPRGVEAVVRVLQESPGKWFTVRLMTKELEQRQWLPTSADPESAVRAALARAHAGDEVHIDKGRGKKTGQITYRYAPAGSREAHAQPEHEEAERPRLADALESEAS